MPQPQLLLCADVEMPGREVVYNAPLRRDAGGHPIGSSLDPVSRALLNSTTWGACCFNPGHLEPVTQQMNVLRALREPRTRCRWGHEWTSENTYLTSHGARQCRACKADRERERRQRLNGSY